MNRKNNNLTEGPILGLLIRFALPVLLAQFLQVLYGAVDLLIVGRYSDTANIAGVANGSQLMHGVLSMLYGFAVGVTVLLGQKLGSNDTAEAQKSVSSGVALFACFGVVLTIIITGFPELMVTILNAPAEAHDTTLSYICICGSGIFFILMYNLMGSIYRAMGDAVTPLIVVAVAAVINIFADLYLVRSLGMGAAGAAYATVSAQGFSAVLSIVLFALKKNEAFRFTRATIKPTRAHMGSILRLGFPLSLQETLVTLSFLVILIIVNSLSVEASAGAGVANKLMGFIMLIPSACSASLSAFTAQNVGAGKHDRARKALRYMITGSLSISLVVAWFTFFHGDLLCAVFTDEPAVIQQAWDYMRAYSFDCLLTSFLFCFLGYYNGYAQTRFVMLQGLIGAFFVRIPVAFLMSRLENTNLFLVGLSTPASSTVQIVLCFFFLRTLKKRIASGDKLTV